MADAPPATATETPDALISADDGRAYWQSIDADVQGMLGGFAYISRADLQGSRAFLAKLGIGAKSGLRTVARILEGGAGIGRITEGLLLDVASHVDVVEPIAKFTEKLAARPDVSVTNVGLEEWIPEDHTTYNVIWNQWCVGHLTDEQLVAYLRRCRSALAPDGFIVVKENQSSSGADIFDDVDSSVTRTDEKFREIFKQAGLSLIKTEPQHGFPKTIMPVRMYALR